MGIKKTERPFQSRLELKLKTAERKAIYEAVKEVNRYLTPSRQNEISKDLKALDDSPGEKGEIDFRWRKKKTLTKNGDDNELTREWGRFRKVEDVVRRDAKGAEPRIEQIKRFNEVSGAERAYKYADDGTHTETHKRRKDGRFEEKWELDEEGNLFRSKYTSKRKRDLGRTTTETVSEPYIGFDGTTFRRLTVKKGSKTADYERDKDGKLRLLGKKSRTGSVEVHQDPNRLNDKVETKKYGGLLSKSYTIRKDEHGTEIGRDTNAKRKLLSKRTAVYDDDSGRLKEEKHSVAGGIYKSKAEDRGDKKYVTRRLLGFKISGGKVALSDEEKQAQSNRAAEALLHKEVAARIETRKAPAGVEISAPTENALGEKKRVTPSGDLNKALPMPPLSSDAGGSSRSHSAGSTYSNSAGGSENSSVPTTPAKSVAFNLSPARSPTGSGEFLMTPAVQSKIKGQDVAALADFDIPSPPPPLHVEKVARASPTTQRESARPAKGLGLFGTPTDGAFVHRPKQKIDPKNVADLAASLGSGKNPARTATTARNELKERPRARDPIGCN